jgi:hypothetical protein
MKNISQYKNLLIVGLISLLVGRFVIQPKQEVKEVIKYVQVEVKKEKKKKVTTTKETTNADGSSTVDTTIEEDSSSDSQSSISYSDETKFKKANITIGVLALKDLGKFSEKTNFGVVAVSPLLGNLSIVGTLDTTKRIGLGIALEF